MKTKSQQFHDDIRNRYIQELFQKARQQSFKMPEKNFNEQIHDIPSDINLDHLRQQHLSWGCLFDEAKNLNNLQTLANIYNQIHYGKYSSFKPQILQTFLRKIIDELQYQSQRHALKHTQNIQQNQEAIIIMLILIYKELDLILSNLESHDKCLHKILSSKVHEIMSMMNIRESVKNKLGMFTLKKLQY